MELRMLTVEQYADSDVNERRIADYEVKLGKNAVLKDINELLKNYSPGGGGDIPEFDGGEYGAVAFLNSKGEVEYYTATSSSDLFSGNTEFWNIKILDSGESINNANLLAYSFGKTNTANLNYRLSHCYNLRFVYGLENVTTIGQYFLTNCTSLTTINIPSNVKTIGAYFLFGCGNLNQLTIPSTITSINIGFLQNCINFVGTLTVEAPASIIRETESLTSAYSWAPMYTQGIKVNGTYAQDWIDKLANKDTSPFRKLILAE